MALAGSASEQVLYYIYIHTYIHTYIHSHLHSNSLFLSATCILLTNINIYVCINRLTSVGASDDLRRVTAIAYQMVQVVQYSKYIHTLLVSIDYTSHSESHPPLEGVWPQ